MKKELDYIWQRRSVRSFTGEQLSDEHYRELLEAAMAAPSACRRDPWHFIVVKEHALRLKMASVLVNGQFLARCGGAIVICGNQQNAHDGLLSYMLQDCSAAMENILLAAPGLGLGGCWLGVHPRAERISALREIFNIPEYITPFGACALGFPAVEVRKETRFDDSKIHCNCWSNK